MRFLMTLTVCLLIVTPELPAVAGGPAGESVRITRSIYVPVRFVIAPGVGTVHLWLADRPDEIFGPQPRVFMFTYYPEHKRLLPESIDLRIRSETGCEGVGVNTNVLITPSGIYSSTDAAAFDNEKLLALAKSRRRDLRVPQQFVHIKCAIEDDEANESEERPVKDDESESDSRRWHPIPPYPPAASRMDDAS